MTLLRRAVLALLAALLVSGGAVPAAAPDEAVQARAQARAEEEWRRTHDGLAKLRFLNVCHSGPREHWPPGAQWPDGRPVLPEAC